MIIVLAVASLILFVVLLIVVPLVFSSIDEREHNRKQAEQRHESGETPPLPQKDEPSARQQTGDEDRA